MIAPIRVQLSRRMGWKIPANTKVVSRPSKFGNPFRAGDNPNDLPFIVVKRMTGELGGKLTLAQAGEAFAIWIKHSFDGKRLAEQARAKLRGKNIACWCPLSCAECHAETLLKIANE